MTQRKADMTINGSLAVYRLARQVGRTLYSEDWLANIVSVRDEALASHQLDANVREAVQPGHNVIIKFVKAGLSREESQQLESEIETLMRLQQYERDNQFLVDGHSLLPTVIETRVIGDRGPAFLVESCGTGQPIHELIRERTFLTDVEALQITAQTCRLLEVLRICPPAGRMAHPLRSRPVGLANAPHLCDQLVDPR